MCLPVSSQTCRQESPTCMVIIICTLVPGVSRKGSTACYLFPSNQSLVIHHHILVCASLNSPSSLQLQTLPSHLHRSVGPLYLPAATAVDFIHSLALLYMNRLVATHTSICSSYVSTQPPPLRYQEWNVCF